MRTTNPKRFKNSDTERSDRTDLTSPRIVSSCLGEVEDKCVSEAEREKIRTIESKVNHPHQSTGVKLSSSLAVSVKGAERNESKLPEKNVEKNTGKGAEKSAIQVVPCWILINLSHNSLPDGDVPNGTATTAMKVSTRVMIDTFES